MPIPALKYMKYQRWVKKEVQKTIFSLPRLFNFDLKIGTCGSRRPNSIGVGRFVPSPRIIVHPVTRFATANIVPPINYFARGGASRAIFLRVHPAVRLVGDAFRARRATFNFSPTTLTHFSSRPGTSYRAAFFFNDRRASKSGRFIRRPRSSLQYSVLGARSLARSPSPSR